MTKPTIVAHRGASGYLPEHTLAAYELGVRQGADAFEIDVVPTKDGVLIARHENDLSGSTDVATHPAFAARRTTKTVNGHEITGWFSEDFTIEEIKELRCVEPLPGLRSTAHDGRYAVPTLREILDLRASLSVELGRPVGLKLEVKTPEYFTSCRLPIEDLLIPELTRAGVKEAGSPVEVMTFELHHLRMLRTLAVHAGMVFLVEEDLDLQVPGEGGATYGDLLTPGGLARVTDTANAIGPGRAVLFPPTANGALGEPSRLFDRAHEIGLRVDCWTFRAENHYLPTDFRVGDDPAAFGDMAGLVAAYVSAGLDTVITDHPDRALRPART